MCLTYKTVGLDEAKLKRVEFKTSMNDDLILSNVSLNCEARNDVKTS